MIRRATSPAGRLLRPFVRQHWLALAGVAASSLVLTLADLARPWPLKLVIDGLFTDGWQTAAPAGSRVGAVLAATVLLLIAIAVAEAGAKFLSELWVQRSGERIVHDLRTATYDHLQRQALGYHQRRQKGDLVTRVTGDVNAVGGLFTDSLAEIVQSVLLLVGILVAGLILDPLLGLLALVASPVLAFVSWGFRRRIREVSHEQRNQDGHIASAATETLSAIQVVKAHASEDFEGARVERASQERMRFGVQAARLQASFQALSGIIGISGPALVLVVGSLRVLSGALTPGDLIVLVSYAKKASSPLRHLTREVARASRALARADRIAEVLEADERLEERPGAYDGGRAVGNIELRGVSFRYQEDRPVLDDVSLDVPAGSRLAVIGPSGAGKSTLAALIARFHDPTVGDVLLDGRDLRDCTTRWLRQQIGVLLQDSILFTGTVADNVAYAVHADRERIEAAARMAAADDFIQQLPQGLDTALGPQGAALSGGQRQRIGIARTILRDPPVLVLDEPTAALDATSEMRVIDGLRALMEGRTAVVVTHSADLARLADRIVVVVAGRIVADGPPGEILSHWDYRRYVGTGRHTDRTPRRDARLTDPVLHGMQALLDTDAAADVLQRSLGTVPSIDALSIRKLKYKPGEQLLVLYEIETTAGRHDAVAFSKADVNLAKRAAKPHYVDLARRASEQSSRTPAQSPLAYEPDVDALVWWEPVDPDIPALSLAPDDLAARLRDACLHDLDPLPNPLVRLRYRPRDRAVLRIGDHVLKLHADSRRYERALAGLRTSSAAPSIPTAAYEGEVADLRLTVQSAVDGTLPGSAAEVALEAGALAWIIHHQDVPVHGELPALRPADQLERALNDARVVGFVAPHVRDPLEQLTERLRRAVPSAQRLVVSHGDFHPDQLIYHDGDPTVIDFDDMCLTDPAFDLATYIADVVRGRDSDLENVGAVVWPLLEGYGEWPRHLRWHVATAILGRAAHPFRIMAPDWPDRVEATVAAAATVLGGDR